MSEAVTKEIYHTYYILLPIFLYPAGAILCYFIYLTIRTNKLISNIKSIRSQVTMNNDTGTRKLGFVTNV